MLIVYRFEYKGEGYTYNREAYEESNLRRRGREEGLRRVYHYFLAKDTTALESSRLRRD
jgi:hypothetical protein